MQIPSRFFPEHNFSPPANNSRENETVNEQNLFHYASEAADDMGFDYGDELQNAVKRAMELCSVTGQPLNNNFKRIFKSSPSGIFYDWKLSILAFRLVKLNGDTTNPKVAELQMQLLNNFFQE